jgi:hypothetical protein
VPWRQRNQLRRVPRTATSCSVSEASFTLPSASKIRDSISVSRARSTSTYICGGHPTSSARNKTSQRAPRALALCSRALRWLHRTLPSVIVRSVLISFTVSSLLGILSRYVMASVTILIWLCSHASSRCDAAGQGVSAAAPNAYGDSHAASRRTNFSCARRFVSISRCAFSDTRSRDSHSSRTISTHTAAVEKASPACTPSHATPMNVAMARE